MNALNLLNKWLEITKFDPGKKIFNLFDMDDYEIRKTNEFIVKICNEYDNSGLVPLIYVKYFAEKYFKNLKVSVLDILQNHYDDVKALREFYDELNSDELNEIEKDFSNKLKMLSASICSKKYLDDHSDNNFINGLGFVIDNITKLKVDIFLKGGEIKPFNRISKSVHHFNSLADCLLALEQTEDGIYLCYIAAEKSVDGYFGYFIKNNRNIFSINERIDEKYIGQTSKFRNNRYVDDNKLYNLFPYDETIQFSGMDYKGYASNVFIDDEKLSFENFKTSTFNCIILTMYLLSKKYVGKTLEGDQVLVNSMLKQNIKSLEVSNNDIMLYKQTSALMKYNESFEFKVDENKFLKGDLCSKYNSKGNYFQNINQILVDIYGSDFDFQKAYHDILVSDKTKMLMNGENNEKHFNNEFIGSKEKFELQAFYELRKKLAEHIQTKMIEDYKNFGGVDGITKWWRDTLISRMDKLKAICKEVYLDTSKGDHDIIVNGMRKETNEYKLTTIKKYTAEQIKEENCLLSTFSNYGKPLLNPIKYSFQYLDIDDGHTCKFFFCFKPYNWKWIEETFDIEVPNFMKGWYNSHYFETPYRGNWILDVVDPVDRLEHIINLKDKEFKFNMNFFIGFSTNNMKKILKN